MARFDLQSVAPFALCYPPMPQEGERRVLRKVKIYRVQLYHPCLERYACLTAIGLTERPGIALTRLLTGTNPTQNETPASASRNRDHQRRSRARRREYVADLQQRLQQYERRGVEATLEMQQASRAVALENQMLRALLYARGVSQQEIDVYPRLVSRIGHEAEAILGSNSSRRTLMTVMKSRQSRGTTPKLSDDGLTEMIASPRRTNAVPSPLSTPPRNSASPAAKPLETVPSLAATSIPPTAEPEDSATAYIGTHDNHGHDHNSPCAPQVLRQDPTKLWNNCPEMSAHSGSDILPPVPDCYCPPDPPASAPSLAATSVSCEVASRIIVEYQWHMDSSKARELLDCIGMSDCLVQNSKLFRILDSIA